MRPPIPRCLSVVIEVFAVFAAGSVLGMLFAQLLGIPLRNPLNVLVEDPGHSLVPLAGELAAVLGWQYLGWFLCAGLLWLLRPIKETQVATHSRWGDWRGGERLAFVALIAALAIVPMISLTQAQAIWQFGSRAPWFDALQQRPWDASFWLFTAVGSFALIPLIEELFYRGYVFRRLADAAPPLAAATLSATLFAFSHAQYLQADPFNVAMLAAVSYLGILLALATLYSRSLVPAVLAHAAINLPMLPSVAGVVILVALGALVMTWHRWDGFRRFVRSHMQRDLLAATGLAALSGAGFAMLFHRAPLIVALLSLPVWLGFVVYRGWRRLRQDAPKTA